MFEQLLAALLTILTILLAIVTIILGPLQEIALKIAEYLREVFGIGRKHDSI